MHHLQISEGEKDAILAADVFRILKLYFIEGS
jgi:hypothetical protein